MLQPKRTAHGRAALLWAVVAFVGVQLLFGLLFDYRWFRLRYPWYHETVRQFDAQAASPKLLFVGSSRTTSNVVVGEIDTVLRDLTGDAEVHSFRAALAWGDPVVCERVVRDLLDRGARPRCVVVECCPEGVHERGCWLTGYVSWLLCWHDLPAYARELAVTGNLQRFAGGHLLPTYVYRYPLRHQLHAELKEWYDGTSATNRTSRAAPEAATRDAAAWQGVIATALHETAGQPPHGTIPPEALARELRNFRPGGNSAARLERLIRACRERQIEVLLVSVPLSKPHRDLYTPECETRFQAHMAELVQRHGCRYVDYRARLPEACFCDHHHTTVAGGCIYSRMLAVEVLAPLWRQGLKPDGN